MKIKAIVTGATGMVGEGVLHICLNEPNVESVLVINRRPCGIKHPKLKEIIHNDFMNLTEIENNFRGYNACYFCAGVSSIGKNKNEYTKLTYDLTIKFAKTFLKMNNDQVKQMTFIYISGTGTDSSEKRKIMWARVKGKTENDLMKLPFGKTFMFRPGYIQPIKGLSNSYSIYKFVTPFYPIIRKLFPQYVVSLDEIGKSMISVTLNGFDKNILECEDIKHSVKKLNYETDTM